MAHRDDLTHHLFRLVRLVRSAQMKRVLSTVDPQPHLNFWRVIHGDELDIAVLEWCKIFGATSEPTHWKTLVPTGEQARFRSDLLAFLRIDDAAWAQYWEQMKAYRDSLVAHHIENEDVTHYPVLDIAVRSSFFYYRYVIGELRSLGVARFPDDLERYASDFEIQCMKAARLAIQATAEVKERVF